MQSRNFRLQKVGDINWLEKNYKFQEIALALDELIVLNATKNEKDIKKFALEIPRLVQNVFIPVAAGGGIRNVSDAQLLFDNGADKIVLNSAIFENPSLVEKLAKKYGAQSIVASIDYKNNKNITEVYINDGQEKIGLQLNEYLEYVSSLNIGEIYLNSIDKDGTGFGYDLMTIASIKESISFPLIIAGGAGNEHHLKAGLEEDGVSAVATANLFNFMGESLPNSRKHLLENNVNLANFNLTDDVLER